jgi:Coenzyme PQQ synthesis protein D (PqqD)
MTRLRAVAHRALRMILKLEFFASEHLVSPLIAFDEARVAHETIDGETMIMDTVRGHIIMVGGAGSFVLELIGRGISRANLLDDIGDRYGQDERERVRAFVDELTASGVLVEIEQSVGSDRMSAQQVSTGLHASDWPASLAPILVERYEDIADIIAMDPIHDVHADGWPKKIT